MIDYSSMTDEELAAESAALAEKRTEVRLAQNAVSAEIEIRAALATLSVNARARLVKVELGGEIGATAETDAKLAEVN